MVLMITPLGASQLQPMCFINLGPCSKNSQLEEERGQAHGECVGGKC